MEASGTVLVVVAHPDDETIGCGGLLAHLRHVTLVVITDGAPRDMADASAQGFADCFAYAAARTGELEAALAELGPVDVIRLGVPDQAAARRLVPLAQTIADILVKTGARAVLTHAFEGGHPDHDAVAFATHMAVRRSPRQCRLIEMPFYHLAERGGMVVQQFASPRDGDITLDLPVEECRRKRRMMTAHHTQRQVLAMFSPAVERYRPAPNYDFSGLPNDGRLLYEQQHWGLTGAEWQQLVSAALRELQPCP